MGPVLLAITALRSLQSAWEPEPVPLLLLACMLLTCEQFMRALSIFHGTEMDVSCQEWGRVERGEKKQQDWARDWWQKLKQRNEMRAKEEKNKIGGRGVRGLGERELRNLYNLCHGFPHSSSQLSLQLTSTSPHSFIGLPFTLCGASWTHWHWLEKERGQRKIERTKQRPWEEEEREEERWRRERETHTITPLS